MASTEGRARRPAAQPAAIRQYGDPVLRTPTDPIAVVDDPVLRLVDVMFASMYAAHGVGLAANQIGVSRSVFVMDCDGVVATVINPRLVDLSEELQEEGEGCLSVSGRHYPTARAAFAAVEGTGLDGAPVRVEGTGQVARCLQHETDHLAGKLYIDRLAGPVRKQARRDLELGLT